MLALYRSGRQAEALRAYQKTRTYLLEELGLDTSTRLRQLEQQILNHDPALELEVQPQIETLAFLLTDIEDSTVLWELQTEEMRAAVERHDRIVRAALESAGGRIVKRVGDGIDTVFADVGAAVAAAEEIQRELAAVDVLEAALLVRMAIDVGEVESRDGDYFGPVLNRAGRSSPRAMAGRCSSPPTRTLRSQQARRAGRPRRSGSIGSRASAAPYIFQLLLDGLPSEFPPLRIDRLPPPVPAVAFGRSVRGYELREEVGRGDSGIVFRAYQPSVGREVAIKIIRPELVNQPSFVRGFEAEASRRPARAPAHRVVVRLLARSRRRLPRHALAPRRLAPGRSRARPVERGAGHAPPRPGARGSPTHIARASCTATSSPRTSSWTRRETPTSPTSGSRRGSPTRPSLPAAQPRLPRT